jgi:hypothetical protein
LRSFQSLSFLRYSKNQSLYSVYVYFLAGANLASGYRIPNLTVNPDPAFRCKFFGSDTDLAQIPLAETLQT